MRILSILLLPLLLPGPRAAASPSPEGWFSYRGHHQNGTSQETGLPEKIDPAKPLWTADLPGQSAAVISQGKLYILGYTGDGPNLQEVIACFDAETGKPLWEHRFNDFLSDTIYLRYSTSSPTIDPETGNIYMQGTQGILACFSPEGKILWQISMMEAYGRMTFPNSRTATPVIDGNLVITRGITSNWGTQGPASDRFYAFDKRNGELVWASSPGDRPRDNSFSLPILAWLDGRRVFYAGTGDGGIVCVNARTGEPVWRVPIAKGGVNAAILLHKDHLIAVHGSENIDSAEIGRMVALRIPKPNWALGSNMVVEAKSTQAWQNNISAFTSSPILVGDRLYQVAETGDLCAVDTSTGKILWKHKLGIEQRNASMVFADGKLYIPVLNYPGAESADSESNSGSKGVFYIIRPGASGAEILSQAALDGRCFGSPVVYNGKIYVQTTSKLYCFGKAGKNPGLAAPPPAEKWPAPGKPSQLQIVPSEVLLRPGDSAKFRVWTLDEKGFAVEEIKNSASVKWASFIPPTARVRATMKGEFDAAGTLNAARDPTPSAGAFEASLNGLRGYIRGRVLPSPPLKVDFESFELSEKHATETNVNFAYPPLPWIGPRFKFEVRELEGNKVLAKTIDNKLFQRAFVFLGLPDLKNYTIEADVLSEGTRRKMSEVGLINQRYCIVLKGNSQELEVNSNLERIKVSVPFKWSPKVWYRLKSRVDLQPDGSGVVRAKAWKKEEAEPEKWTIEVPHQNAHPQGAPGLFGFSPQEMRVYLDNISVTLNP